MPWRAVRFAIVTMFVSAGAAHALDADRLQLGLGSDRGLAAEGATVPPHLSLWLAVAVHHQDEPFVLSIGDAVERPLERVTNVEIAAALALGDWFELAVGAPIHAHATGTDTAGGDFSGFGFGDLRAQLKVAALRPTPGWAIAILLPMTYSTGPVDWWLANDGWTATPQLLIDGAAGPLRWRSNLGYRVRGTAETHFGETFGDTVVMGTGPEVALGGGASLLAEVHAEAPPDAIFADELRSPVDALGGVRWRGEVLEVTAAGGGRLNAAAGAPTWRALLQLGLRMGEPAAPPDRDGDGVPDALDRCLLQPEDRDGVADDDGCPEIDHDDDGRLDAVDQCPGQPEDPDGIADADGCPETDADGDGVGDSDDACPEELGDPAQRGCPPRLADTDGDGIRDVDDRCPNEAETINQVDDDDGCPDTAMSVVRQVGRAEVVGQMIVIDGRIRFRGNRLSDESRAYVDDVARLLLARPDLVIRIEGHTDDEGGKRGNQRLSKRWAKRVATRLTRQGVPADRLRTVGLGAAYPIESNATPAGRAANRRIELHLVDPS